MIQVNSRYGELEADSFEELGQSLFDKHFQRSRGNTNYEFDSVKIKNGTLQLVLRTTTYGCGKFPKKGKQSFFIAEERHVNYL